MEKWRDIEGYEGVYQVSNQGRVKSLPRNGTIKSERILRPAANHAGYYNVLFSFNHLRKHFSVHRLVAKAFIPNPENKPQINHIDGNKTNNTDSNLEWVTSKENMQHACKSGLLPQQSNLNDEKVRAIRTLSSGSLSQRQLGKMFGVGGTSINDILNGKSWKHI